MLWIDTASALETFLAPLDRGGLLALDTEFLRTKTYYPRFCLLQLAREDGTIALVDPLSCDLTPLWQRLSRGNITFILHAAFQDLELLYQASDQLPAKVFDTQIAALLHEFGDQSGLNTLLGHFLEVTLPKDATRTDWCQRPLKQKQQDYAANDVRYLIPLYHALTDTLTPQARAALEEDFAALLDEGKYAVNPETAWLRLNGGQRFSAKQQTLLRKLSAWREETAQQENLPRRWVIGDDTLMALAKRPPANLDKLKNVPGLSAPQMREYGEAIMTVLDATFAEDTWEKQASSKLRPTPEEEPLLQVAKAVVQQQALDFHFNPNGITTHTLLSWLRQRTGPLAQGWRHLLIGAPLEKIQNGEPLIFEHTHLKVPYEALFTH